MAMIHFHPCQFDFQDQDIRREGLTSSGGTSLSGYEDVIRTDGGGFVIAEFTNGETWERQDTLAWRALTDAMDGGAVAVVVHFCDRLHQPVGDRVAVPHSDDTSFSDDTLYVSSGASASALAPAALRATSLRMTIISELPLLAGEWFTIVHPNWGERAYRVINIDGDTIQFRPPLREAITSGTPLDFDDPRCRMRLSGAPGNPTNMGRFQTVTARFVEDMRTPA
jgi:hypothetical protein